MNVRVRPHKRGNGKWAVDYYCPATHHRKYESFDSKQEAVARKKELEGKEAKGEYRPLHKRTWAEFIAEYREKVLNHKKLKTRKAEDEAIGHFERHCTPSLVANVNTRAIDEFKAKRRADDGRTKGEKVSLFTVNKNLGSLRTILRTAHRWGFLPIMPEMTMLRTGDYEPRPIPPDVFDKILEAAAKIDARIATEAKNWQGGKSSPIHKPRSQWWIAALSVGYLAGFRWDSEILNLKWADLRFTSNPTIRVWNQKASRLDHVPMSKTLEARLQDWMNANKAEDVADDRLVFSHRCHSSSIFNEWLRIQKAAGIAIEDHYRLHDLRVSFCTNHVAAGTSAPQLMKLARHSSIATTMKFYRGQTDSADRDAAARMENYLAAQAAENLSLIHI